MTPITACDRCGQPIKAEWSHCPFCGAEQAGASDELLAPEVSRGLWVTERRADVVRPPLPDPEHDHWDRPGTFFLLEADDDLREAYFESLPDESETTEPNQICINELARELEVKAKVLIDYLPEAGVTEKKTHSSSIDLAAAEKVRKHFLELADAEAATEAAAAAEKAAKEVAAKTAWPGVEDPRRASPHPRKKSDLERRPVFFAQLASAETEDKKNHARKHFVVETPRYAGAWIVGLALLFVLAVIALAFIFGIVWVSKQLYPIIETLSILGFIALVLNLLPSAIFVGSRRYCGNGIVLVSYVWGTALWMYSTLALYQLWGPVGMFLGFALLGFGSVPLACIALLLRGDWSLLGQMILSVVIVFATRALGYWVKSKGAGEQLTLSTAEEVRERVSYETGLNRIQELRIKIRELMNRLEMDEDSQRKIGVDMLLGKRDEEEVIRSLEAKIKEKERRDS